MPLVLGRTRASFAVDVSGPSKKASPGMPVPAMTVSDQDAPQPASAKPAPLGTAGPAIDRTGRLRIGLVVVTLAGLCTGLAAPAMGADWAAWIWNAATALVLVVLIGQIVTSLLHGDVGLDVVAALSMGGALALGQSLAAFVVALMYAGGQSLEV